MKGLLQRANEGNYAVMAINSFNLESARAVIDAAQQLRAPIIINLLQEHLEKHLAARLLIEPLIRMANAASVEVAVNLDHGREAGFVKYCLREGFSSVMIDVSRYELPVNIRITRDVVKFAEIYDASVEAEVGSIGTADRQTNGDMLTDPETAIGFAKSTGIHALAVSYGSSHGCYPAGFFPTLHFDIVEKIKSATRMPLVLHGGSGCGLANIKNSLRAGINKINVGSDFMKAQTESIKQQLAHNPMAGFVDLIHQTMQDGTELVKKYILAAESDGKSR